MFCDRTGPVGDSTRSEVNWQKPLGAARLGGGGGGTFKLNLTDSSSTSGRAGALCDVLCEELPELAAFLRAVHAYPIIGIRVMLIGYCDGACGGAHIDKENWCKSFGGALAGPPAIRCAISLCGKANFEFRRKHGSHMGAVHASFERDNMDAVLMHFGAYNDPKAQFEHCGGRATSGEHALTLVVTPRGPAPPGESSRPAVEHDIPDPTVQGELEAADRALEQLAQFLCLTFRVRTQ